MNETKRKVLFLVESLEGGHAGKMLSILVQYMDRSKFDVTVCAINAGGKYESVIRENATYKTILTGEGGFKRKMVYKNMPLGLVYKMYVPQGFDVEVACSEGFATKLLSHSSNSKAKKYAWVHSNLDKNHWTKEVFSSEKDETEAYNHFDKIICVSQVLTAAFKRRFDGVTTPVDTIYSPVDSLSVRLKSLNTTNDDEPKFKTRIVTQGPLEAQHEYSRLLRIVDRLVNEGYDIGLWVFGDGGERGIMDHFIRQHDLKDRVKLFGAHPNPYRYMILGDLFVCSCYSPAVINALILGLPVVATSSPEINEVLKDGKCALLTQNNEDSLYEGIKRLLDDPKLLEEYKQKGEARGWDFDIEAMMAPIEYLLNA